jgi:hypothetical protein
LHFLAETEVVFGLWAAVLFACVALVEGSLNKAVHYIESLNFTEAKFVLVVMVVAATRPVVLLAEAFLNAVARLLPLREGLAFYLTALAVGPLLGSFITEPAAMTICALLLSRQFFDLNPSQRLKYATLGLLFVNVSIGGTLTHFAAPPVLMVARPWGWDTAFMLGHFGWRAAAGIAASTTVYYLCFRGEFARLATLPPVADEDRPDDGTGAPLPVDLAANVASLERDWTWQAEWTTPRAVQDPIVTPESSRGRPETKSSYCQAQESGIMAIAVLGGTGKEGKGLAYRWAKAGYQVLIGSRTPEKAIAAARGT